MFRFLFLFIGLTACVSQRGPISIAGKHQTISYSDHYCSEEKNGTIQSYGFFDSFSSHKALALVEVRIGWLYFRDTQPNIRTISYEIEKLKIEGLENWEDDSFSLSLRLINTRLKTTVEGEPVYTYKEERGVSNFLENEFKISARGNFEYEGYGKNQIKFIEDSIHVEQSQLQNVNDEYRLFLVLKNTFSRRELELEGPLVSNIGELSRNIEEPRLRVLGLFDVLNPAQEGGLFHTIATAPKRDSCLRYRNQAKEVFDEIFNLN